MLIRVDPSLNAPVFQQIVDGVKSAISSGAAKPGDMIPSVRQMAAQALVNPNTVAKAYRDLEREGVLTTRRGLGVFVAEDSKQFCRDDRRNALGEKLARITAEARRAGINNKQIRAALESALGATDADE